MWFAVPRQFSLNNNNLLHFYNALHSKGDISSSTTNVQHPPGWCVGSHSAPERPPHTSLPVERRQSDEANQCMGMIRRPWRSEDNGRIWPGCQIWPYLLLHFRDTVSFLLVNAVNFNKHVWTKLKENGHLKPKPNRKFWLAYSVVFCWLTTPSETLELFMVTFPVSPRAVLHVDLGQTKYRWPTQWSKSPLAGHSP